MGLAIDCPVRPRDDTVSRLRLGDIVRVFADALRETSVLTSAQHEVLFALARCRTAALGGHLAVCDHCGHATPVYNSCRNRHCPTCQSLDQHRWLESRRARILPTRYFHVVFTLPEALRAIVRHNPTALFAMLFHAASQTLLALARDPRRLGALPAITMVLHTWTRELLFHPHIHAVVSAGGLSLDGTRWVPTKGDYLFPVKVLAKLFRGKLRAALVEGLASGTVTLPPNSAPDVLDQLRTALYRTNWVVYAKAPFGGAEQVYAYHRSVHPSRGHLERAHPHDGRAWRDLRDEGRPRVHAPGRRVSPALRRSCAPEGLHAHPALRAARTVSRDDHVGAGARPARADHDHDHDGGIRRRDSGGRDDGTNVGGAADGADGRRRRSVSTL